MKHKLGDLIGSKNYMISCRMQIFFEQRQQISGFYFSEAINFLFFCRSKDAIYQGRVFAKRCQILMARPRPIPNPSPMPSLTPPSIRRRRFGIWWVMMRLCLPQLIKPPLLMKISRRVFESVLTGIFRLRIPQTGCAMRMSFCAWRWLTPHLLLPFGGGIFCAHVPEGSVF